MSECEDGRDQDDEGGLDRTLISIVDPPRTPGEVGRSSSRSREDRRSHGPVSTTPSVPGTVAGAQHQTQPTPLPDRT